MGVLGAGALWGAARGGWAGTEAVGALAWVGHEWWAGNSEDPRA